MDGPSYRWWHQRRRHKRSAFDMSAEGLRDFCREQRLYASCPELNEILHLHQKGITAIENLDEYTGLKTLHLEFNAISKIQGLDHLVNLRCLHLNQNLVQDVEGLGNLVMLQTLDLADNQIKCIRGLSCCPALRQLNVSGNQICLEEDVAHLTECKSLVSLDIARNAIDDERALEVLRSLSLTLAKMCGNPIVSKTHHYRKMTVVYMSTLRYLDDCPVSDNERRLATSWFEGGVEGEAVMRDVIRKEEAVQRLANHRAFEAMIERVSVEAHAEQSRRLAVLEQQVTLEKPCDGQVEVEGFPSDATSREPPPVPDTSSVQVDVPTSSKGGGSLQDVAGTIDTTTRSKDVQVEQDATAEMKDGETDGSSSGQAEEEFDSSSTCQEANEEQECCAQKEKEFRRQLHQRLRERAARGNKNVWGTELYTSLWQSAVRGREPIFNSN